MEERVGVASAQQGGLCVFFGFSCKCLSFLWFSRGSSSLTCTRLLCLRSPSGPGASGSPAQSRRQGRKPGRMDFIWKRLPPPSALVLSSLLVLILFVMFDGTTVADG